MADFHFVLSAGPLSLEGGGAYVRGLADALNAAGHTVRLEGDPVLGSIAVIDGAALASTPVAQVAGAVGLVHHTTPLAGEAERAALRQAERSRLPLLRRVVVTSDAVRDRLVGEFGVASGQITVIRPGIPAVPRSRGSGGPDCTILAIGALVPRKGHDVLLRALARLFDLPWRLVIAGDPRRDPACADALRAQAEAAGIADRVRFAGILDAGELEGVWRQADIFALATQWEGYSAPVAEALRRGLPVAVTTGGAAAELVGPEMGVIVPPGDSEQLSKAMRRMIFDTGLRTAMADAAWRAGQDLPDWPAQARLFTEAALA